LRLPEQARAPFLRLARLDAGGFDAVIQALAQARDVGHQRSRLVDALERLFQGSREEASNLLDALFGVEGVRTWSDWSKSL